MPWPGGASRMPRDQTKTISSDGLRPKTNEGFRANRAYELRGRETGANRSLIEAIVARYQYPMPEDLTDQNTKYLEAMQKVHEQFFNTILNGRWSEAMIHLWALGLLV